MKLKNKNNKIQVAVLMLPGLLFFLIFTIYPILKLLFMSFFEWDLGSLLNQSFIGLDNYKNVLNDQYFHIALENTVIYTLVTVPGQMIIGLFIALLINNIPKFQVSFRVFYYLPVITSWVIASLIFRYIFNSEGLLNYFLNNILNVTNENIAWLDSRWGGMTVSMILGIWKGIGWNMVVFLAALQTIPKELYEAAAIDGAGAFQQFVHVTLPGIRRSTLYALVMLTIGGFAVYTSIEMLTGGAPAHQTEVLLTWMYFKAFTTGEFGYSAALSFIIAFILAILASIEFRLMKNIND